MRNIESKQSTPFCHTSLSLNMAKFRHCEWIFYKIRVVIHN
ncbi:hypothetical protein [Helicobacter sp. T3_23-1059]